MEQLTVIRWRRYGHDRLYVERHGLRLGYWDVVAGEACVEVPDDEAAVSAAAAEFLGVGVSTTPATPATARAEAEAAPACEPEPAAAAVAPEWTDLALNLPGAAARAQARALREAAPVRTVLARALGVKTDERAWRIGADGEEAVAAQLAKLGARWRVLHAVPVGARGSDIDHLVIGPGGVFTLNAKHHPDASVWVRGDTFKVNGQNQPYVRNSRFEAERAARLLSAATDVRITAMGVIVVYGATRGFTVKEQPEDVRVVARRQVARWLRRLPPALTGEQVEAMYEQARRSTTWQPGRS